MSQLDSQSSSSASEWIEDENESFDQDADVGDSL